VKKRVLGENQSNRDPEGNRVRKHQIGAYEKRGKRKGGSKGGKKNRRIPGLVDVMRKKGKPVFPRD